MFERDVRMVEYARHYGVLDWIPEDGGWIWFCSKIRMLFCKSTAKEDMGFYVFLLRVLQGGA